MLTSMTGFGRAEVPVPPIGHAAIEIHTLNHRFLEVDCRLPDGFQSLEGPVRTAVAGAIRRGRVRVSVALKTKEPQSPRIFQAEMARRYLSQLRALQRRLKVPGEVTLEMLLGLPQVIAVPEKEALSIRWWPHLKAGILRALEKVLAMRRQEGQRLARNLMHLVDSLEQLNGRVRRQVPAAQTALQKRWADRIQRVLRQTGSREESALDRKTVVAEAAAFVQATDVSEELTRIDSHLKALRQALSGRVESPGRTADFLAQELHREANTLGAKMREGSVVRWVIAMKNQIEKIREQVANVE